MNGQNLYGSSRVGVLNRDIVAYTRESTPANDPGTSTWYDSDGYFFDITDKTGFPSVSATHHKDLNSTDFDRIVGQRSFELTNHLGNVLSVVSDHKLAVDLGADGDIDYMRPDVISYSDYYPFGMIMPQREGGSGDYRYGFQGQEKDNEIKDIDGSSINYKYRMHDPRIGRFFAVDPLAASYPHNSPYAFSENVVINALELEGLEKVTITPSPNSPWMMTNTQGKGSSAELSNPDMTFIKNQANLMVGRTLGADDKIDIEVWANPAMKRQEPYYDEDGNRQFKTVRFSRKIITTEVTTSEGKVYTIVNWKEVDEDGTIRSGVDSYEGGKNSGQKEEEDDDNDSSFDEYYYKHGDNTKNGTSDNSDESIWNTLSPGDSYYNPGHKRDQTFIEEHTKINDSLGQNKKGLQYYDPNIKTLTPDDIQRERPKYTITESNDTIKN